MAPAITRREFTRTSIGAGVGAMVADRLAWASSPPGTTRYAIVGVGGRSQMYQAAVLETYAQHSELVAVCDVNVGRMELVRARARGLGRPAPAAFDATQFDRMIAETQPDCVIVTTPCGLLPRQYICRAMELGCDVITEKPMTTDAEKCQRILDTQTRTGRQRARDVQLPLLAAAHAGEGPADARRDRRRALRRFPLAAGHAPRRRLLPPLAPRTRRTPAA